MTKVTEHAYMKIYYYDCFNNNIGFPHGSDGKESSCDSGDLVSIPGMERSPGEGNGYPLQHSCLETPMDKRSLVGYSPWSHKESDATEQLGTHVILT